MQLRKIEEIWAQGSQKIIVTDPHGVIFITSYAPWKFRALYPLEPELADTVRKSKQYGDIQPDPLVGTAIGINHGNNSILELKKDALPAPKTTKSNSFLLHSREMPEAGWVVHILSDISQIKMHVRNIVLLVAFLFAVLLLSGMLFHNRRKRLKERNLLEDYSRDLLTQTNEQLEQRVAKRTSELTKTNARLQEEIDERKRAEIDLKKTQAELIQAGKLAVIGQMSASISHEINQPMAAIRMYAENGCVFLEKGQLEEVKKNLAHIADLIGKIDEITRHLKSFSRKSPGTNIPVPIARSLNGAMVLLDIKVKQYKADVLCTLPEEPVYVLADPIRLEQVLVNIIGNALDAVDKSSKRKIWVKIHAEKIKVLCTVHDSGPGIASEHLEKVFDPFFTSKKDGKGLGLGLSLSLSIIRDFGGLIRVENHPAGGALISMELVRTYPVFGELP